MPVYRLTPPRVLTPSPSNIAGRPDTTNHTRFQETLTTSKRRRKWILRCLAKAKRLRRKTFYCNMGPKNSRDDLRQKTPLWTKPPTGSPVADYLRFTLGFTSNERHMTMTITSVEEVTTLYSSNKAKHKHVKSRKGADRIANTRPPKK